MAGAELPVLAFTAGILLGKGRKPTLPSSAMSACETRNGEKEKPVGPMALASLFQPGKSIADPLRIPASADETEHNKRARSTGRGLFPTGQRGYSVMCHTVTGFPSPNPRQCRTGANCGRNAVTSLPRVQGLSPSPGFLCHP